MADGSILIKIDLDDSNSAKGIADLDKALGGISGSGNNAAHSIKNIVTSLGLFKVASKAVDMMKGSLDSAFGRIDTMEQFARTMGTITGDTDAAAKALDELRVITKGTAYGLDVAAKATQDFVTRGMDISKATKQVEVWGDAVAFYGKGTNEQLGSVMDALAKMQTKGNVTMEQMNRLYDVGIDAVGMYAQATKQSTASVQKDLSKGKISSEQFIDTVTKAMSEGTNGVHNLSGAAKEAGTSFAGSFDNMRAATTRGVVEMVTAIDTGLTGASLPSLREMIASVGKTFESTLGGLAAQIPGLIKSISYPFKTMVRELKKSLNDGGLKKAANGLKTMLSNIGKTALSLSKTVIPKLCGALDFLAGNLNVLIPAVIALHTAMKTWQKIGAITKVWQKLSKAINSNAVATMLNVAADKAAAAAAIKSGTAISAKHVVVAALKGEIGKATAAQYLWNAAMAANPIGIVVVAVAALAGGIAALTLMQKSNSDQTDELTESQERNNEVLKEAAESWAELTEASEKQIQSDMAMIDHTESLWNELKNITDENGKIKEGYEDRANYIVGELSKAMETEIEIVEGVIKSYDNLAEQMDVLLAKKRADAILTAKQGEYNEALTKANEIAGTTTDTLINLESKGNEVKEKQNQLLGAAIVNTIAYGKDLDDMAKIQENVVAWFDTMGWSMEDYGLSLDDIDVSQNGVAKSLEALGIDLSDYGMTLDDLMTHNDKYATQLDTISKQTAFNANDTSLLDTTYTNLAGSIENNIQEHDKLKTKYQEGVDQLAEYMTTIENYDKLVEATYSDSPEIIRNAMGQIVDVHKATTVSTKEEYKKQEKSLSYHGKVMNDVAVTAFNGVYTGYMGEMRKMTNDSKRELKAQAPDFEQAGKDNAIGYKSGISSRAAEASSEAGSMVSRAIKAIADAQQSHSPAKKSIEQGKYLAQGYGNGISGNTKSSLRAAAALASQSIGTLKDTLKSNPTKALGQDFTDGFAKGIASRAAKAAQEAANMVKGALSSAQNAQRSNSPAKETRELGHDYGDGYVLGILDRMHSAISAAGQMARNAVIEMVEMRKEAENKLIYDAFGFDYSKTQAEWNDYVNSIKTDMQITLDEAVQLSVPNIDYSRLGFTPYSTTTNPTYNTSHNTTQNNQKTIHIDNVTWNNPTDIQRTMEDMGFIAEQEGKRLAMP